MFCLLFGWTGTALAQDLKEALAETAKQLSGKLAKHEEKAILIQVVNLHNKKTDSTAKSIETELYQALEREFPGFRLVFLSESVTGVNLLKALLIKGEYEQKGPVTTTRFVVFAGIQGESIAQAEAKFDSLETMRKSLVAVLDLEAKQLSSAERRLYSDMLREELGKRGAFNLASSADISKMDPDAVQSAYGCTRDECATIIGEQLGVDQVVSTSYFSLGQSVAISGKLFNIRDGSIVRTATVKGKPDQLEALLSELATKLTGVQQVTTAGRGQFRIDSQPSGAVIFLDGQKMEQTTSAVFTDIPAGRHQLRLVKGDLGAFLTFELAAEEIKKLQLDLSDQAEVSITSTPFDALVSVDGTNLGSTPLKTQVRAGMREFRVRFESGAEFRHQTLIQLDQENILDFKEKELAQVRLEVKPADAQVQVEGQDRGGTLPETIYSKDEEREVWLALPAGTYRFGAKHPHQEAPVATQGALSPGAPAQFRLELPLKLGYRDWQDYHQQMASRSSKLTWTIASTLLTAGWAYSESQQTTKAQAAQSEAETNRDAAWVLYKAATDYTTQQTYYQQAQSYHQTAIDEAANAADHNQKAQAGAGVALALFLVSGWFWLDEPGQPPAYGLVPRPDGWQLQWSKKW